ncbi:nicotinate-nucleotide--dimethylbenzimidazole phosphoribosyltransferase [Granulicella arctica]|uniref:nicotinate-nucleotide--dimethylbenzimidazole phosphoribosyltransferase n=1 Tax=Granulicella arctica TaxID=940613 RepID=UPI0021E0EB84|nr:nicotinate-nucleotide--dimethylbenzimidazole phosphoribosyltransferase [Granulicella arctica]
MNSLSNTLVSRVIQSIAPVSEPARLRAQRHLDTLTKPLGSLGRLEPLAAQIVAIHDGPFNEPMSKGVYIFAADHGVAEEGVSAYPREVTHQMVLNFVSGGAAINVLARLHNATLTVVDVGVDADFGALPGLVHCKVCRGTKNMLHEAAMTDEELAAALSVGISMADRAAAAGHAVVAIGEMGIGNTTAASVITCQLTGSTPELATGLGTGVEPAAYARKLSAVRAAQHKYFDSPISIASTHSALEILRCVGGLEIAAMTGMILAAAQRKLVVVVDGFISAVAAALAVAMEPHVAGYLIAGHCSKEPGHKLLLNFLGLTPVLDLGMRLGEGTGAVLAFSVLESAIRLYTEMATFASAQVSEASQ